MQKKNLEIVEVESMDEYGYHYVVVQDKDGLQYEGRLYLASMYTECRPESWKRDEFGIRQPPN